MKLALVKLDRVQYVSAIFEFFKERKPSGSIERLLYPAEKGLLNAPVEIFNPDRLVYRDRFEREFGENGISVVFGMKHTVPVINDYLLIFLSGDFILPHRLIELSSICKQRVDF